MSWESVGTSVLGSIAGKVVTSLLGDESPAQTAQVPAPATINIDAPTVKPVSAMETPPAEGSTTPRSVAQRQAQRASIAAQMRRRGRASTILSDPGLTADATLG